MNICRFYGQLFLEYSVELVFFGLSSSPNLFIEPRKNLKGSELDDAKCLQKIRKILRDMPIVFPLCSNRINFYLDFTS